MNHGPPGLPNVDAGLRAGATAVYPPRVSDKPPQTYILHTVALFIVLAALMVVFLRSQWG